jgi:hypothetical protein
MYIETIGKVFSGNNYYFQSPKIIFVKKKNIFGLTEANSRVTTPYTAQVAAPDETTTTLRLIRLLYLSQNAQLIHLLFNQPPRQ